MGVRGLLDQKVLETSTSLKQKALTPPGRQGVVLSTPSSPRRSGCKRAQLLRILLSESWFYIRLFFLLASHPLELRSSSLCAMEGMDG